MRIAMISCDWKDSLADSDIDAAAEAVGGKGSVHFYTQDEVDASIAYISSEDLTDEQLDALWEAGDLCTEDEDYWEGTFEEITEKLAAHMAEEDC